MVRIERGPRAPTFGSSGGLGDFYWVRPRPPSVVQPVPPALLLVVLGLCLPVAHVGLHVDLRPVGRDVVVERHRSQAFLEQAELVPGRRGEDTRFVLAP